MKNSELEQSLERVAKTVEAIAEAQRKAEEARIEAEKARIKTQRIVANVGKQIGDVHLDRLFVRQRFKDLEYDFVGINSTEAVVGEFKRTMRKRHVHEFYNMKLPSFFAAYPEYSHLRLWGMVAAKSYGKDVAKYAEGKGFYVLAQDKLGIRQLNRRESVRSIELKRKG